ncbi:MAG: glycosyltransferase [Candidatus Micrarchaeia archaeon]
MVEISVIIPSLNEEKYIENTLQAFKDQTFKDFEIIVSDSMSTDKTREIAKKYAKVVTTKLRGISNGRNVGASKAKGKIYVFIDADTIPEKTYLEAFHKVFQDKRVVVATGPILPYGQDKFLNRLSYSFVSVFLVNILIRTPFKFVIGSNFAIRKEAFEKLKGFDPNQGTCEDLDLAKRAGKIGKIRYTKYAKVYTSTRRIDKWGKLHYVVYHTENYFRYYTKRKVKEDYEHII